MPICYHLDIYELIACRMEGSIKTTSEVEERICTSLNGIDYMICLSHFFLALNSSLNAVIYAWRGKKFV